MAGITMLAKSPSVWRSSSSQVLTLLDLFPGEYRSPYDPPTPASYDQTRRTTGA